jgi:type VI protein secretion system component Hcp
MHYPGIDGEANGIYYRWIELINVQFPRGRDGGEIVCTKEQDSSSVGLHRAAQVGTAADVEIHLTSGLKPGEAAYLKLTLKSAFITGYNLSGSVGSGSVIESLTLNFAKAQ